MNFHPMPVESFADYRIACSSATRDPNCIPVIVPGACHGLRREKSYDAAPPDTYAGVEWKDQIRVTLMAVCKILEGISAPASGLISSDYTILTTEGPVAVCAALLAGYFGLPLHVTAAPFEDARRRADAGERKVVIVALAQEITDAAFIKTLDLLSNALVSQKPWDDLPRISIITGRNVAAVSTMVFKIISRDNVSSRSSRILHLAAKSDATVLREVTRDAARRHTQTKQLTTPDEIMAALTMKGAALAYEAHGTDACARAGLGVVLCGLNESEGIAATGKAGVLCCAQGFPCPRGPQPVPLKDLNVDVLMLASCNSFRLADSLLTSDFNLALSFLDGAGLAYIGSVLAGAGGQLSSILFTSALSSGRTVSDAACLANALLISTGIERNIFLVAGAPEFALAERAPRKVLQISGSRTASIQDCSGLNLAEFLIANSSLANLGRRRKLGFSLASSEKGSPLYWFARPERASAADAREALRVFVFRFPEPLGHINLRKYDGSRAIRALRRSLQWLRQWTDILRLSGLSQAAEEGFLRLRAAEQEAAEALTSCLSRLPYDGSAPEQLDANYKLVNELILTVRAAVLEELVKRLSGPFWLPHLFSAEYLYVGSIETVCANCAGVAIRRSLRHPMSTQARSVDVCLRCGIVADVPSGGLLQAPIIQAAELASPGTTMHVRVLLQARGPAGSIVVHARLSGAGSIQAPRQPESFATELKAGHAETCCFSFQLPPELPPHQYVIKVIAASMGELAFASRPFFAGPAQQKGTA
jgi:hypothetical protein